MSFFFLAAGGAVTPSAASVARMRQANEVGPLAPVATSIAGQLPQSRQGQQLDFLLKRQLLFKRAALAARKKGDIQTAKKYLISAKVRYSFLNLLFLCISTSVFAEGVPGILGEDRFV